MLDHLPSTISDKAGRVIFTMTEDGFDDADLQHANLRGADFVEDHLGGVTEITASDFNCAEYDGATVFPKGFDPDEEGMINVVSNGA